VGLWGNQPARGGRRGREGEREIEKEEEEREEKREESLVSICKKKREKCLPQPG
jgi:hypothetical protein